VDRHPHAGAYGASVALPQQRWRTSREMGFRPATAGRENPVGAHRSILPGLTIDRSTCMKILGHIYRFVSNFVFLALVYFSLNFLEKYQHRAIVAILVLVYASMRAASTLRSFNFFQKIERLELEARRLAGLAQEGPSAIAGRKKIVSEVGALRRDGEMKSYVDLLFLAMVVLLCVAKIVTD
jgi:hypothetical protein